jgi:histidyl-tRNA synthetase
MGWLTELAHMRRVDFVVAAYSKDMMEQALQVAESIRRAGASADVMLEPKRKVWQVRVCICISVSVYVYVSACPCVCVCVCLREVMACLLPASSHSSMLRTMTNSRATPAAQAFDYGDRAGAKYLAFVAPDEWQNGMVRIKNLRGSSIDGSEEQGVEEGVGQSDGGGKQVDVPWEGFRDTVSAMMCK